jgi:hypothetical protein
MREGVAGDFPQSAARTAATRAQVIACPKLCINTTLNLRAMPVSGRLHSYLKDSQRDDSATLAKIMRVRTGDSCLSMNRALAFLHLTHSLMQQRSISSQIYLLPRTVKLAVPLVQQRYIHWWVIAGASAHDVTKGKRASFAL